MESIKIRQRVGQDGILHLDIPIQLPNREIEAVVIYQPVQPSKTAEHSLASLYGICADNPIILNNDDLSEALDDELTESSTQQPIKRQWSPRFFERTAGVWQGEPLVRAEQGEQAERESFR